jgi:hypothetical protein
MKIAFEEDIHYFKVLKRVNHGYNQEVNDGNNHTMWICLNIVHAQAKWKNTTYRIMRGGYDGVAVFTASERFVVTTRRITHELYRYREQCERIFRRTELNCILPAFVMWKTNFAYENKLQKLYGNLWDKLREKHHRAHNNVDINMAYENWRCGETNG